MWPPSYSYANRQSKIITSSNSVLNGARIPGGGLGVEQAEDEDGDEAPEKEEGGEEVSVSDAMPASW